MKRSLRRLITAGVVTGITDGLFASVQSVLRGSTVTRLWQGVASTLLGKAAFDGGTRTALIGVVMHFCVAVFWSAVFILLVTQSASLRRVLATRGGTWKIAAVYGPSIWLIMSLIVIPLLVQRPPAITSRWWVQFVGHIPFVAFPIVSLIAGRAMKARSGSSVTPAVGSPA